MPICIFTYNPVLISMNIKKDTVEIDFKKRKDERKQTRVYIMDQLIAYGLFYSKTPLDYFNEFIKNQTKVIEVKY